jgi:hypothetical protein
MWVRRCRGNLNLVPRAPRPDDDTFPKPSVPYKLLRRDPLSCEGDGMDDNPNAGEGRRPRRRGRLRPVAAIAAGLIAWQPAGGRLRERVKRSWCGLGWVILDGCEVVIGHPDPNSNGQLQLSAGPGSDLLPNNPQFSAAQQACKSLIPAPGTPAQQRKDFAVALRFAHCMRSHGLPSFPDPPPPGSRPQTQSQSGSGGNSAPQNDPNSPQFQAASRACRSPAPSGGVVAHQVGPRS